MKRFVINGLAAGFVFAATLATANAATINHLEGPRMCLRAGQRGWRGETCER